ncbi:MAG TPA: phage antirepressor N-terminal domain-containing protein [Dysgonamonadaceae bacterium]|nr:phage antirepressor N-terminal domain-containing protein [Dysgonamonadaceae bacterium]
MKTHEKFLEFNGKNIVFLNVDGVYWIALKPICKALNIDYIRSFKNAKNDTILGPVLSVQPMQVSKNGKTQLRNVTCIPEKYIYGWIFSLRSDSEELTNYKKTCYELLYNHFHGTITNRKELLIERNEVDTQIHNIKEGLKEENDKYLSLQKLEAKKKALNKQLNSIDKELIKEPELF